MQYPHVIEVASWLIGIVGVVLGLICLKEIHDDFTNDGDGY